MSDDVSIKAYFWKNNSPKEIMKLFLDNGWKLGYDNRIYYVRAKDDIANSHYCDISNFSLEEFLNSHSPEDHVTIDLRRGDFYGTFLIDEDSLDIIVGDVVYMEDWPIPDFSWYLKELIFLFEYAGVRRYTCQVS